MFSAVFPFMHAVAEVYFYLNEILECYHWISQSFKTAPSFDIDFFVRQWKCFQNKSAMLTHVCATSCAMMIADASPMSLLTVLPNCVAHVEPNAAKPEEKIG